MCVCVYPDAAAPPPARAPAGLRPSACGAMRPAALSACCGGVARWVIPTPVWRAGGGAAKTDAAAPSVVPHALQTPQYAPEPLDIGQMLVCSVVATPGEPAVMLVAPAPVVMMEGLEASLQVLRAKPSAEFNVVVVQRNGEMQDRREARAQDKRKGGLPLRRF